MADELASPVGDDRVWKPVMTVETAYKASYDCFGIDIWEVLEDRTFPEPIRNNYIVGGSVADRELSNEVYRDIPPYPLRNR